MCCQRHHKEGCKCYRKKPNSPNCAFVLIALISIVVAAALALAGMCAVAAPQADAAAKKPARVKIASVKSAKPGQLTVKVKKAKGANGYQYKVGTNKKLTKGKKAKTAKKRTATFTALAQGKTYYVKVRAFAKKGKKKVWGKWSAARSARVQAALLPDPTPDPAPSPTPAPDPGPGPAPDPGPAVSASGESGSCTWTLYLDGSFVVAPTAGASGELGEWSGDTGAPWSQHASDIEQAAFRGEVRAATCHDMFKGCSNLSSVDLSGFDTSEATDMVFMFEGCSSLASLKTGEGWSYGGLWGDFFKPKFPSGMQDESGSRFSSGDYIPEGAHTYTSVE